jgi:hypothetical protein
MPSYWRSGEGRIILETAARWVVDQAAQRGRTINDYIEGRCSLSDLGITTENAKVTLKIRLADAHTHYNENAGSREKMPSWEAWFSQRLRNRIFYFFHRHDKEGRIVRCVGEWPLPLPKAAQPSIAAE